MIGLTDHDLALIRSEAQRMLTDDGVVRRRPTRDAEWVTVNEQLPCLLQMTTRREDDRRSDVAADVDANCMLLAELDADLRRLDRVSVDGRVIELRFSDPRPVAVARWLGRVDA